MGIIEKIVEANVGAVAAYANAGSERRPQRVIMNKADLYALLAERPEVEEDGHIYGLRIELGHKGHPILCID